MSPLSASSELCFLLLSAISWLGTAPRSSTWCSMVFARGGISDPHHHLHYRPAYTLLSLLASFFKHFGIHRAFIPHIDLTRRWWCGTRRQDRHQTSQRSIFCHFVFISPLKSYDQLRDQERRQNLSLVMATSSGRLRPNLSLPARSYVPFLIVFISGIVWRGNQTDKVTIVAEFVSTVCRLVQIRPPT